jgi:hypothetical protein
MANIPMGPKDVYIEYTDERVNAEINRINAKFVEMNEAGVRIKFPTVVLILSDYGLSLEERETVATLFEREAWTSVKSRTSSENGERPGLIVYTFSVE